MTAYVRSHTLCLLLCLATIYFYDANLLFLSYNMSGAGMTQFLHMNK